MAVTRRPFIFDLFFLGMTREKYVPLIKKQKQGEGHTMINASFILLSVHFFVHSHGRGLVSSFAP